MKMQFAVAALLATSAPVCAADLAIKAAAAPVAAPGWQGFYVGATAGAVIDQSSVTPELGGLFLAINPAEHALEYETELGGASAGFTGGATLGYNWQWNSVVAGLEADIAYADRSQSGLVVFPSLVNSNQSVVKGYDLSGDWFCTLRARLGVVVGPTLLYATGGLAFGDAGTDIYIGGTNGSEYAWAGGQSGTRWGWTVGGGAETRIDAHWSVKAEYLYVDLGSSSFPLANSPANPVPEFAIAASSDYAFSVVRAGVNYRF
ncbi:outer membrane protein [Xanthobacter autotrophicus]|uniref:outer membrane protein n=1 Tax=Xanthobacter autotrophicus TaxID=280 RepID=UPI00372A0D66